MSNYLAVATVSAALRQRVLAAVGDAVTGTVAVLFGRPPAIPPTSRTVNVYLYRVTPNAALRNNDLPARDGGGRLVKRPRAAVELHYLFSFYGDATVFEPERMLAAVVRDLHAQPVLDPQTIADAVAGTPVIGGSDLKDADERVRFSLELMSLDDLSRLWSLMVQAPHAVSVAYAATPVMLDARESGAAAAPVLRRGEEDRGVETQVGPFPQLDSAWVGFPETRDRTPRLPSLRAAQPGALLVIDGANLGGDTLTLGFSHPLLPSIEIAVPPAARTASRVELVLPPAPAAGWAAGIYAVVATVVRGGTVLPAPVWPLLLAPRIMALTKLPGPGAGQTLRVGCSPDVLPDQAATLRIGDIDLRAEPHPAATATLDFIVVAPVPTLTDELVWLRVGGAESMPFVFDAVVDRFAFDPAQRVTLP